MARNESNILYRRLLRSYFSSVISISLVLFLVGMAGVLIVNARSVSNYFKENITVSAILTPEADEADASALADSLERTGYVKEVRIISKEEGTEEMKEILGDDFMDVFEVNPIPVSLELQIAADYIYTDSLAVIEESLYSCPAVGDVVYQQSLVELLEANLERIGLVVGIFVLLLLFISVVLINNTVRLNVYAKRFTIHTMRLVGATKGFITRPFVGQAFFQGMISGAIADVFILGALYLIRNEFYQLFSLFDAMLLGAVMAATVVLGMLICMISTSAGVRSLISLKRSELYY
ncbi:efflux ABC transporter permease protein [Alistipes sp. CAG:831]|nr:efflux ABC transporter permease protein [Alistipes sp. CAG:831]